MRVYPAGSRTGVVSTRFFSGFRVFVPGEKKVSERLCSGRLRSVQGFHSTCHCNSVLHFLLGQGLFDLNSGLLKSMAGTIHSLHF